MYNFFIPCSTQHYTEKRQWPQAREGLQNKSVVLFYSIFNIGMSEYKIYPIKFNGFTGENEYLQFSK